MGPTNYILTENREVKILNDKKYAYIYCILHFTVFPDKFVGEPTAYVNTSRIDNVDSPVDTDYPQTDVTHYANQSAVSALENMSAQNWGQASDVTPYANQSTVSAMKNTSAQNALPHQEKPELSPYEDVRGPVEYEMLGRHSPQLPTVYDSIK